MSLGDVRLEDGSLSYINRQTGDRHEVEQINLKLALQDIDSPFEADGSLTYEDETLVLRTKIDQPRAIVEGGNTPLTLTVRSNVVSLALDGQASGGEEVSIGGKTDLNVPSVRGLAAWLGAEVPMEQGFNELDIQGQLNAKADTIAFTDATLAFDEINGTGAITLATGGSVPSVTGSLAVDILDLRPYSGASQGAPGGGGPAGGPGGSAPASEEWSNDPIDFSGLKAMNADLDLSANQIFVDAFEIGKSVLAVTVKDGVLTTNLSELALYEGVGKGTLTVDGRRRNAVIRTNLSLTGVQSQPIVKALMDKDFLAGAGKIEFNLTTSGNSQRQFMRALDGRGQVF
ncbi:MAG: AsmA family protein, partial [Pseudomonadota bacterium]